MDALFEVIDKSKRIIRLTKKQWKHIAAEHPEVITHGDDIQETLKNPVKIIVYPFDNNIRGYYKYIKKRSHAAKNLLVVVKYLNGSGFIITTYFVRHIP